MDYVSLVLLRIATVTIVALPIPFLIKFSISGFWYNLVGVTITSIIVAVIAIYQLGLNSSEKDMLSRVLVKKIHFLKKHDRGNL